MQVLAVPATNHVGGLNHRLLLAAAELLQQDIQPGATVELIDLNQYEVPIYSDAREAADGIPDLVRELFTKFGEADALMVSFAEYNGSFTAAWKNLFDWMTRIDRAVYHHKPVAMFACSPGPRAGASVLDAATARAEAFGARLVGVTGIGPAAEHLSDDTPAFASSDARDRVHAILTDLVAAVDSDDAT